MDWSDIVSWQSQLRMRTVRQAVRFNRSALFRTEVDVCETRLFSIFDFSRRPMNYKVMLGGHEIFSGETMTVVSISIHPLYQIRVSAYDLALVRYAFNKFSFGIH